MLNQFNSKGIWSGINLHWHDDGSFDEKSFAASCSKMADTGVAGVYTTGTSGELHAIDFDEFKSIVDVFAEVMKGKKAQAAVGCHAWNTKDVLKRIDYVAQKKSIGGVQFSFPSWITMKEQECYDYIDELCSSHPELGFWHYNTMFSKVYFQAGNYPGIVEKNPNFFGVKWTNTDVAAVNDLTLLLPQINVYLGESVLLYGMMCGAVGCCSSLVNGNPKLILDFYRLCVNKEWERANVIQQKINAWMLKVVMPYVRSGVSYPAIDKAITYVGNFDRPRNVLIRKPYSVMSDQDLKEFEQRTIEVFPEFIYQ
jgi:dihydrodipicolinate synthase/N-acetylneuraminate lyase